MTMSSDAPPFPPRQVATNGGGTDASFKGAPDPGKILTTFEEYLRVGSTVRATTIHGVEYLGEVMAVDNKTALVFLAVKVGGSIEANPSSMRHNVVMFNLNTLHDLQVVKENPVSQPTTPPGQLRISDSEQKLRNSVNKKLKRVEAIGVGVSRETQLLFDKLSHQYSCSWSGTSIKVEMLKVTIETPYSGEECVKGDKSSSVEHIRTLVAQILNTASSSSSSSTASSTTTTATTTTTSATTQQQCKKQQNNNNTSQTTATTSVTDLLNSKRNGTSSVSQANNSKRGGGGSENNASSANNNNRNQRN